jgi:hypothetical protein
MKLELHFFLASFCKIPPLGGREKGSLKKELNLRVEYSKEERERKKEEFPRSRAGVRNSEL